MTARNVFGMRHVTRLQEATDVPCNGCRECCKNELLILHPEHGDDPREYLTQIATNPLTGEACFALKNKPNGNCIYLGESGCTIYDRRPAMCREFDCRRFFKQFMERPRAERRLFLREGLITEELLDAGRARSGS